MQVYVKREQLLMFSEKEGRQYKNEKVNMKIVSEFLMKYEKISSTVQKKLNDEELKKCCHKSDARKYVHGIYIGAVNSNSIPHTNEENPQGIFLYEEGFLYFGEIKNGKRKGTGILINEDGDFYYGNWDENNPNNKGEYFSVENRRSYKGEWEDGIQQGKGIENYEDGSIYSGEFSNGLKHGKGRLQYPDGTFYEGEFMQNCISGFGISEGKFHKYEGEWFNGKMHGNGISTWTDAKGEIIGSYIGQYKNGLKHGYGEYKWGEQKTYKGNWEDGDMKSEGVLLNYD